MLYVPNTLNCAFQELLEGVITPAQSLSWLMSHFPHGGPDDEAARYITDVVIMQIEDVALRQTTIGEAVNVLISLGAR